MFHSDVVIAIGTLTYATVNQGIYTGFDGPVVFVGHELTPHTKAMMKSGLMSLIID